MKLCKQRLGLTLSLFCSPLALISGAASAADATLHPVSSHHTSASSGKAKALVSTAPAEEVIATARRTRSEQSVGHTQLQRILPGVSPLKALQILPGVVFNNADPWGNNEQNSSLFIHGFNQNQLGYTLDGIPLGDQAYGNYNGLSPSVL